ncbi:MAG TPA: insulinase family protein [Clostridiaceae bacterium]|nr:insulinase family protein [Clostridiaceae bacterium]
MLKKITLDNGVRVVLEKIPYVRSVSLGIWVGAGSRNESPGNNGISHFIEHMLFKGTTNRTAKEIAESIDSIGGQINAFTGKECTCYYTKTLDTHVNIGIDILSDMFFNSKFSPEDIEIEKNIVFEEINMYEDSPEELVHDILSETVWHGNSLGFPILGNVGSLRKINRESIHEYMKINYTPKNTVISVAGNYEEEILLDLIKERFDHWKVENDRVPDFEDVKFIKDARIKEKDTEQVHICLAFEGIEQGNDNLYSLLAINNVLGGGMSSRLFQKIREEMGLVYSIYSYPSSYKNAGLFTVYAGMNPDKLEEVLCRIKDEIKAFKAQGITRDQLEKSKEQLKGSFILSLESTSSRMNSIGKSELMLNKIYTPDEVLDKIDKITMESVHQIIDQVFDMDNIGFSAVGNIKHDIEALL